MPETGLPGRCAVVPLLIVNAPVDVNDESAVAVRVVTVAAAGVVAPTVPLMLIEAVPVRLVTTPDAGVPRAGVTNVGEVAKTSEPVPVSFVMAAARLALDGVAKNAATFVPRPLTPVVMGRPVALVRVALEGVPRAGVTKVGLVANTKAPEPVSSVTAEAKFAELGVARKVATFAPKPLTPVEIGKPVAFVKVPDDGVPSTPPLTTGEPAVPTLTARAVAIPVPRPDTPVLMGRPVALVKVTLEGVPRAGVTSVGDVANTADPLPVSSVKAAAKLADVNDPSNVAFPVDVTAPVRLALVVTFPAVSPAAVPVMFVPTKAEGVPSAGVTSIGDVANTKAPVPVSSVTAEAKLAELGVAKNVATPVPKPLIPVLTGSPVAFVNVTEVGVPNTGVTSVGDVAKTLLPVPVLVTLTMFLLASSAKAVEAVRPDRVVVLLALSVVNAPVLAVVAPTVPLIGPENPPAVIVPVTLPEPLK